MRIAILVTAFGLSACSQATRPSDTVAYEYTVSEDGPSQISNRNTYESLGDKTFTRNQKYKIIAKNDDARNSHLLVLSVTQLIGKKVEERDKVLTVFIKDGTYSLDCEHYYDVKITVPDDSIEDPVCKIKLLGIMKMDANAKLMPS